MIIPQQMICRSVFWQVIKHPDNILSSWSFYRSGVTSDWPLFEGGKSPIHLFVPCLEFQAECGRKYLGEGILGWVWHDCDVEPRDHSFWEVGMDSSVASWQGDEGSVLQDILVASKSIIPMLRSDGQWAQQVYIEQGLFWLQWKTFRPHTMVDL